MKWKELKEFCNSLDEKQLERDLIFWRENESICNIEVGLLSDDHYIGEDEEHCYPLSYAGLTLDDVDDLGLVKVYSAGDAFLKENF